MRSLPLIAALSLTSAITAQTFVLPTQFTNASAGNTGNVWRAGTNRVQCFYDATNFGAPGLGVPLTITGVEFRLHDGLQTNIVTYPNVEIYLQNAATNFLAPSTTFANNRTVAFPTTPNGGVDLAALAAALAGKGVTSVLVEGGGEVHASFLAAGHPAVLVTDTAMLRNPRYHGSEDVPETLDFERMGDVVLALQALLVTIDG